MLNESGLRKRAELIQAVRAFFIDRDYIEVDTPVRLPVVIPEAHNEPVESGNDFLQTSPEICMKRLLAGAACTKIFQICPCFRKNERGDRHVPEFTMLEWYRANCDYRSLMDECEDMIIAVARSIGLGEALFFKGFNVSLEKGWDHLTVSEAFARYAPVSMAEALKQNKFDEILCTYVEPRLGLRRPLFLYDYPVELGALARAKSDDPALSERFELYIAGVELANGFSELTDATEQRQRFALEFENIEKQGRTASMMPEKFLKALPDMPEAAGIALGLDRLAMVLFNADRIDDVVTFVPEDL
jgi:lysyl-tRNA synthetase class 2